MLPRQLNTPPGGSRGRLQTPARVRMTPKISINKKYEFSLPTGSLEGGSKHCPFQHFFDSGRPWDTFGAKMVPRPPPTASGTRPGINS